MLRTSRLRLLLILLAVDIGNAAIGYARLNISDGQKIMWEDAWDPEHVQNSVAVENVGFGEGVDFLRCQWATSSKDGFSGLVLTMHTWHGRVSSIHPMISALPNGSYEIYVDGSLTTTHLQEGSAAFQLDLEVGSDETDVCILQK